MGRYDTNNAHREGANGVVERAEQKAWDMEGAKTGDWVLAMLVEVVSASNGFGFRSLIPSGPTIALPLSRSLRQVGEVKEC